VSSEKPSLWQRAKKHYGLLLLGTVCILSFVYQVFFWITLASAKSLLAAIVGPAWFICLMLTVGNLEMWWTPDLFPLVPPLLMGYGLFVWKPYAICVFLGWVSPVFMGRSDGAFEDVLVHLHKSL
jgi:hypothetical protein